MKIKFLIGFPAKYCVSDWQQIKELSEEELIYDEQSFLLFKALEHNHDLDRELIKARKKLRLPDIGLTWDEYRKRHDPSRDSSEQDSNNALFFIRHSFDVVRKVREKMILHPQVEEQLSNLIQGYFVEPTYKGVAFGCSGANVELDAKTGNLVDDAEVDTVSIHITKRASKNEVVKFIDKNWSGISELLDLLPDEKHFFISRRDLRIVELRDKSHFKYSEIADVITKEFNIDDFVGSVNEDNIKTSYARAKKKIDELALLREK